MRRKNRDISARRETTRNSKRIRALSEHRCHGQQTSCHTALWEVNCESNRRETDPKKNITTHGFAVRYDWLVFVLAVPAVQLNTPRYHTYRMHTSTCTLVYVYTERFIYNVPLLQPKQSRGHVRRPNRRDVSTEKCECRCWITKADGRLFHPVWVPGLRIDPLRLLARCRKRRLNQAALNLSGLILLLMMVWSKRGNINTVAVVTIVQCNTLVV